MPNTQSRRKTDVAHATAMSWFPVAMRYGGLFGVVFVAFVWLVTNRIEPSLLALFGGMMGVGEGVDALKELVLARQPASTNPENPPHLVVDPSEKESKTVREGSYDDHA